MELHAQDVVVVLKLLASSSKNWTYSELGKDLGMSPSQVYRSIDRAEIARLLESPHFSSSPSPDSSNQHRSVLPSEPVRANLKDFLVYGVKYCYPVARGSLVRGLPTAHAAPPLSQQIAQSFEPPPVWPYAQGNVRGTEFSPLYKIVPGAAVRDPKLYELLALVDAIRDGRAREREIAIRELTSRIDGKPLGPQPE